MTRLFTCFFTKYCQVGSFEDDEMIQKGVWMYERFKQNFSEEVWSEEITLKNEDVRKKCVNPYPANVRIWWASNNASKGQIGFYSAFKGSKHISKYVVAYLMFIGMCIILIVEQR